MWVIGPYETIWITVALVFLFIGPPAMGAVVAWVRVRRRKRALAKAEAKKERERLAAAKPGKTP